MLGLLYRRYIGILWKYSNGEIKEYFLIGSDNYSIIKEAVANHLKEYCNQKKLNASALDNFYANIF